jgi:DNA-3-methyladenine glycosylase II
MHTVASPKTLKLAAGQLGKHDIRLKPVITAVGPCTITPHTNYYQELVDSIISQQLSVKAAHSIEQRFCQLFGSSNFPTPEQIIEKDIDTLRSAGLSRAKALYVQDLAHHVLDGKLTFDEFNNLDNETIIRELTAVKGIGEWTAHMFLLFCMGRLDVLPVGDLGIRNGIRKLYNLDHLPGPDDIRERAVKGKWHPYESVASWYIWQSLDNSPKQ